MMMTYKRNDSGSHVIVLFILQNVLRLWQRYGDAVPTQALQQMDLAMDWPSGVAAEVLELLKTKPRLRTRLSTLLADCHSTKWTEGVSE
jgi:hypothetical protein